MANHKKFYIISTTVAFLLGGLWHFVYFICSECFFVGLFAPTNESIFEHTKLAPIPLIVVYLVYFLIKRKDISRDSFVLSLLVSIFISALFIPLFYYFYICAFGFTSLFVDIVIFLFALILGQIHALEIYQNKQKINIYLSIFCIIFVIAILSVLTVFPPDLPIFIDRYEYI